MPHQAMTAKENGNMKIDHIAESLPYREYGDPMTDDDKAFLKSWNRPDLIPGEDSDSTDSDDAADDGDEFPEGDDYENWTGDQLRAALKKRGLPVSGKNSDLVARLEEDDEDEDDGE